MCDNENGIKNGCCGNNEGMEHGHCRHGRRHGPMSEEFYRSLGTDAKLGMLLHELNHMGRFFGGRGGQRRILHILAEEGEMTQSELTERLGIRPGSASEVIGKLERAGWIIRTESEEDRRTANVSITESGRQQLEAGEGKRPEMFTALSDDEKEQLVSLLEKLRGDWRGRIMEAHEGHKDCCHGDCRHEGHERHEHRHHGHCGHGGHHHGGCCHEHAEAPAETETES